jgi:hypothetical protein
LASALAIGCSRQADIYDEPETIVAPPAPSHGEVPSVPDLDLEEFPECSERPEGECRGVNDFPCAFTEHAEEVIDACFESTDCSANGWVSVALGEDGCLVDIGMDMVEAAFVQCLKDALGPIQCPCGASEHTVFLGVDNAGCRDEVEPDG